MRQDLYGASEFLEVASYSHVVRWAKEISERPAVKRGLRVNRTKEPDALRERHAASDFV